MKRVRMPLMPHEAVEHSGSMDALPAGTSSSQAVHGVAAPYSDLVRLQEERDAAQDRLVHLCRQRDLLKIRVADATAQIRRLESCLTSDLTELSPAGIELVEAAFQPAISQVGPQDNSDAAAAADQAQDDYAAVMAATEDCVAHYGMPSSLVSSPSTLPLSLREWRPSLTCFSSWSLATRTNARCRPSRRAVQRAVSGALTSLWKRRTTSTTMFHPHLRTK
jgi:hypothetical protein